LKSVLIIGCGKISGRYDDPAIYPATSHAPAILNQPGLQITSCVDIDNTVVQEFSKKYKISNSYTSIDEMGSDEHHDLVCICTPDDSHYSIAEQLLRDENKCMQAIFLEKPACQTQTELEQLLHLSNSRNVPIFINLSRRFHPFYRALKKKIEQGRTGDLVRADLFYYGGWFHNGIHVADTLSYIFESQLIDLQLIDSPDNSSDDPSLTMRGFLQTNNADIWIHGLSDKYYQLFDFDFKFTKGRLQIRNFETDITWETANINERGESVLTADTLIQNTNTKSPIEFAYAELADFLHSGSSLNLENARLEEIAPAMKTLWSVNE